MTMGRWSEESESSPTSQPTPSAISAEAKVRSMAVWPWSDRSGILVNDPSFSTMKLLSLIWPVSIGLEYSKPFSQLLSRTLKSPVTKHLLPPPTSLSHWKVVHLAGVTVDHSEVSPAFHSDPNGTRVSVGRARGLGYFTGFDIEFNVNADHHSAVRGDRAADRRVIIPFESGQVARPTVQWLQTQNFVVHVGDVLDQLSCIPLDGTTVPLHDLKTELDVGKE